MGCGAVFGRVCVDAGVGAVERGDDEVYDNRGAEEKLGLTRSSRQEIASLTTSRGGFMMQAGGHETMQHWGLLCSASEPGQGQGSLLTPTFAGHAFILTGQSHA